MADLNSITATEAVRIVGADKTTGAEKTPVESDSYGSLQTSIYSGGTAIGRVNDRLKVDADVSTSSIGTLYYEDMNASTGGVARNTQITLSTWTTLYSYSGSGLLYGFLLTLENENADWWIRLTIDDTIEVFMGTTGIFTTDLFGDTLYDLQASGAYSGYSKLGFVLTDHNSIQWSSPSPISFSSKVEIKVYRTKDLKRFRAGFAIRG